MIGTLSALLSLAQTAGSTMPVGGNIPALRPAYTSKDYTNAVEAYGLLTPGSFARWGTIQWEVEYGDDYRGIDAQLNLCAQYHVVPFILLEPIHWTDPDRWVPPVWSIPDRMKTMEGIVRRIEDRSRDLGLNPYYQLLNEPAGRCTNPPLDPKPGGSNRTSQGEWHPDLFKLMSAEIAVLSKLGVRPSRIVSPSISCILDGNIRSVTELASANTFDWSKVGTIAVNIGGSASWATAKDFPDASARMNQLKFGFRHNAETLRQVIAGNSVFAGKRVIITEFYGGPGRFGLDLAPDGSFNTDVSDICQAEIDAFRAVVPTIIVWGTRAGEADAPNNRWLYYGVWPKWLAKQKASAIRN
ncbi:MAG: hypothetical protein JST12_18060 [Armatimonadetes bacterium]|nr:hypothetical protein [Armatimonadota bacterium]